MNRKFSSRHHFLIHYQVNELKMVDLCHWRLITELLSNGEKKNPTKKKTTALNYNTNCCLGIMFFL